MVVIPKGMSTFILQWNRGIDTKTRVRSRHLLLLFYKISIPIYAFLPGLQNLKGAATSLTWLPALPCLSCSSDLSGDLSKAQTGGSLRGPNPHCRVDRKAVPSCFVFLCTHRQKGIPLAISFLISQNLHLLDHMVFHSKLCLISLAVIFQSCLMSLSSLCLLPSVAAVLGWPQCS
jgi:hypothetical protein